MEFNPYKERLLVVEKISTLQSYEGLIEHLRNQMELEELSKELNNRLDIKQLVIDINREIGRCFILMGSFHIAQCKFLHTLIRLEEPNTT